MECYSQELSLTNLFGILFLRVYMYISITVIKINYSYCSSIVHVRVVSTEIITSILDLKIKNENSQEVENCLRDTFHFSKFQNKFPRKRKVVQQSLRDRCKKTWKSVIEKNRSNVFTPQFMAVHSQFSRRKVPSLFPPAAWCENISERRILKAEKASSFLKRAHFIVPRFFFSFFLNKSQQFNYLNHRTSVVWRRKKLISGVGVEQRRSNDNRKKVEWRGCGERGHHRSRSWKTVSFTAIFDPKAKVNWENGARRGGQDSRTREAEFVAQKPTTVRVLNNTQTVEDERKYTCLDARSPLSRKQREKIGQRDALTETFHSIIADNALSFVGIRFSLWGGKKGEGGTGWCMIS